MILQLSVRANGKAGYDVMFAGHSAHQHAPISLASFPTGAEGRKEADAFREGVLTGVELAGETLYGLLGKVVSTSG